MTTPEAVRELRALVSTYLEGSDDALRAQQLLDAIDPTPPAPIAISDLMDQARRMFGCTVEAIDESLVGMTPATIALYAMGTLSNAQEYICQRHESDFEAAPSWYVADRDANTIRQLINIAKYAMTKVVPR